MFFLIPIGSEEGVRRLPYVTIGLIVLNTVVFFVTSYVVSNQIRELNEINQRLSEIETWYMQFDPEDVKKQMSMTPMERHEEFESRDLIPHEREDYTTWKTLYKRFKDKYDNMVYAKWGFNPKKMNIVSLFTCMFVHGGFFHLLFNMLYLWLVGCNIEDDWSWKVFLGLYLISGIAATLLHTAMYPQSSSPLIGASGAIAGIMGAFMVRHYKTKIRFAYFIWLFITRPLFGTFPMYAGVFFPIWIITEIACAPGSAATGVAHYAHIGGFVFGAAVGLSMKFLGIEKKYVAPMVEDSFEKLKTSPKMKEVNKKLDAGDTDGAIPLLLAIVSEEPQNFDAPLMLARLYFEKNHQDDATVMYNKALEIMLRSDDVDTVVSTWEEIKEKKVGSTVTEKNLYTLSSFFEKHEKYEETVNVLGAYIQLYPEGRVRSKAILRTYKLFKEKLNNAVMAQHALDFLKQEYPDFPVSE